MILRAKTILRVNIVFVTIYMMVINIICSTGLIPEGVRYYPDLVVCLLAVFFTLNIKQLAVKTETKGVFWVFVLFSVSIALSYAFNGYSIALLVWGIRNLYRFFIFFFCSILLLQKKDVDNIYKSIHILFIINVAICFFQYFVLDYWADDLGGTFRLNSKGGNTGLMMLISIETVYAFSDYLNRKIKFKQFAFVAAMSMVIAALGELKAFYLIFVVIIFLSMILNNVSGKTIMLCFAAVGGLILGFLVLQKIAPESVEILNLEGIMEYAGGEDHGYSSADDLSRFRAFEQINTMFFKDDTLKKIFGFGLGSCDVSGIEEFKSPFYKLYGYINYTWFMHGMLYLETGMAGFVLYNLFLLSMIISYVKFRKKDIKNTASYNSGIIIAIIAIMTIWYNATLRNDSCYFVYMAMALPFVEYRFKDANRLDKNRRSDVGDLY